ncbi:MAG TPA: tetratricopeptide repeat protein, partial [Planctomycetota bacterium]|nr:tetratricopeptide repeat protein [Planctomycetota bacterium]
VPLLAPLAAPALLLVLQRARAKAWSAATLAGSAVVAVAASLHTQAPQVSDSQHGAKTMEAEASEAAVRELLLEVPSSIELRFALANALYAMGEYARARHEYERVVQAHPRNRRYLEALGLCCSELGDVPAAKRVFEAVKARR